MCVSCWHRNKSVFCVFCWKASQATLFSLFLQIKCFTITMFLFFCCCFFPIEFHICIFSPIGQVFSIPQANLAGILIKNDCTNKRECKLKCYRKTSVSVVRGKSSVGVRIMWGLWGWKKAFVCMQLKTKAMTRFLKWKLETFVLQL